MTGSTRGGKYPDELRQRGVRMVFEHQDEYPSQWFHPKTKEAEVRDLGFSVELRRIELLTSSMPWKRSTN